jgi:pSer/pThr/pTyr-binding forkhead associated (FHA) protein
MTEYIEVGPPGNTRPRTELIENATPAPVATSPASSIPAPAGPIRVIVTDPNGRTEEYTLDNGHHVIGRPSKNGVEPGVKLNDRFVSRSHAIIIKEPGSVVIRDENSVNGTKMKGERLAAGRLYPLHDGDVLEIEGFMLRIAFGTG